MTWSFETALDRLAKDSGTSITLHRRVILSEHLAVYDLFLKKTDTRTQVPVWFLEIWYEGKSTLRVRAFTQRILFLHLRRKIRAMSLEKRSSCGVKIPKKAKRPEDRRKGAPK